MELIVPELAKRNGVTEKLKADTKWNGYGRGTLARHRQRKL